MKKVLLIAAVAGLSMVSCKKEYTCECTAKAGGMSATATTPIKDTKKNAKETCEKGTTAEVNGASTTCVIK